MAGAVGFIGLGNMGRPMALNLAKRGFSLVVRDIDPAKVAPLRERGAKVADSPAQVAEASQRTIVMVETTAQAESVIAGEQGLIRSVKPGHIVICMSTIDPLTARRLGEQLTARGVAMLDAPVSGGTERAATGELSIIAGGDRPTFEACRDLFEAMNRALALHKVRPPIDEPAWSLPSFSRRTMRIRPTESVSNTAVMFG